MRGSLSSAPSSLTRFCVTAVILATVIGLVPTSVLSKPLWRSRDGAGNQPVLFSQRSLPVPVQVLACRQRPEAVLRQRQDAIESGLVVCEV